MFKRFLDYLMAPTSLVPKGFYRSYTVFSVGTVMAMGIHTVVGAFFLAIGVWPMVAVNVVSVSSYGLGFWLNRRGHIWVTALMAWAELLVHQALCVYFLGATSAFQYYILVLTVVMVLLPGRRSHIALLMAGAAVVYVALEMSPNYLQPVHPLPHGLLLGVQAFNIITVFAFLAVFSYSYRRAAEIAEAEAARERKKADDLLHNILPVPIADELKAHGNVEAQEYPQASVLFSDIVDFTPLSQSIRAEHLVQFLNVIFSEFDELVEARGLEKIKTIGDAYMVAGGIPKARADHAEAVADLALAMMETVKNRTQITGAPLRLRIGINSGPVVAGVIGKRKFIYDMWGDSVNTAARMESHGLPGAIQVTDATYQLLKDRFEFEDRGMLEVKGKGAMRTWILRDRRTGT